MHFKMSSAICFNLDQSEILLSDNVLTTRWNKILVIALGQDVQPAILKKSKEPHNVDLKMKLSTSSRIPTQ